MPYSDIENSVVRTLLYYDIFSHPLTMRELFCLLPQNSLTEKDFVPILDDLMQKGVITSDNGFLALSQQKDRIGVMRCERERRAQRRLRTARLMAGIMKQFPFVRAVFLSGDLSKGVATPDSDIDYVIVTEPHRLWICRFLLICFKKIFLLNQKKYFCLNFFLDSDHLPHEEHNYYSATEIAHLKPLFNQSLYLRYMNANSWIHEYFPNYRLSVLCTHSVNNAQSIIQKIIELPLRGTWLNRLDRRLMNFMIGIWKKRYPQIDESTRAEIFHSTAHESRAFVGNFSSKILDLYAEKLRQYGLG